MSHFPVWWQMTVRPITGDVSHSATPGCAPAAGPYALEGFLLALEKPFPPYYSPVPQLGSVWAVRAPLGLFSRLPNIWALWPPTILTPFLAKCHSKKMKWNLNFNQIHCLWIQKAEAELLYCCTYYRLHYILNLIPQPAFQIHWPNISVVSWWANIHTI